MSKFPRTNVGGLSVSRMVIGSNWFLGSSHCTAARDKYLREKIRNRKYIAAILEVFLRRGVDTIMGVISFPPFRDAIRQAEDRTGKKMIVVTTPVMTIKSMAAGQVRPMQGLTFVWNALRNQDMVTVGVMTPEEAEEDVELSLSILERRAPMIELQETRSKASVKPKP